MNANLEAIANAILYEGYALYPYRRSSVKNRQRWNFGVLYPPAYSGCLEGNESSTMQTECIGRGANLSVRLRFLQPTEPRLRGSDTPTWQEAHEHDFTITTPTATLGPPWEFARQALRATIQVSTQPLSHNWLRLRVQISNTTTTKELQTRDQALSHAMVSTHAILELQNGEFVSAIDPPKEMHEMAAGCENVGLWPVLIGDAGDRSTMLAAPIILYDYPRVAPESAGSLFDGTEIDEILSLRINTLADAEKHELRALDERVRRILERTESLSPEQFAAMHGRMRGLEDHS